MDDEKEREWLSFVAGRVHGINAVLLALAATHPDPASLLAELEKVEQAGLAVTESTLLPDRYIEGMRDIIDRVRNLLNLRLGRASE
jgi:hypothetical protein